MHVAPPIDRLHPPHQAQPPVVPEDRPQLRVHAALYPVVGPREGALGSQGRVEVREEQPLRQQRAQGAARLPDPLVGVLHPAVDHGPLLEEVAPETAPFHVPLSPALRLAEVVDGHQVQRQAVQLPARLQLRAARRAPPHLGEDVEQAPLDLGAGPALGRGLGEPAAAVRDHHVPLRRLAEQPPQEGVEVPRRRVVAVDGARPAALAAPSLRPGARPAVALHGPAARRAFHRFHQHPREQ